MNSTNGAMRGYAALKEAAAALQVRIPDLLVLARQNDPFFCGTPVQQEMADWFVELWQRFGYSGGVHLRRVHYQLVSQHAPTKRNGEPYENTESSWNYLCDAGKYARYLGLIDAHAFEDHRNPDPVVHAFYGESQAPYLSKPEWFSFDLPTIDDDIAWDLSLNVPRMVAAGYEYASGAQPYHVEVWVEKSTMNDVLLPICRRYGVNLVTSIGFQSVSSVVELLRRAAQSGKPARVLYISDFDPAGDGMPVAVARQIEYWRADYAPDTEIKLQPVALTGEQVRQYRLPRIPIKDSDRRKASFEDRYGEGAVELDALEALHPGSLGRIITAAITPYREPELERRYARTGEEAQRGVSATWEDMTGDYQAELDELEAEALEIVQGYRERLGALGARLASDLGPVARRLEVVRLAIQDAAEAFEVDLPALPEPQAPGQDEIACLFDSGRGYFDQLEVYRERKAGASRSIFTVDGGGLA